MDFNLLSKLTSTPAPSGREEILRDIVAKLVKPYVDEIKVDKLGNLVTFKKGTGKTKLMLTAHLDEVSMRIRYIEPNGFLRFALTGGIDPRTLLAQRVVIMTEKHGMITGVIGAKPAHYLTAADRAAVTENALFIDLGMDAQKVSKIITVGDPAVLERTPVELGDNFVSSKALDDRAGVYGLIKLLQNLPKKHTNNIYAVFTVEEEFGLVGAEAAVFHINPDIALTIDTTGALDTPGIAPQDYVLNVGKGVGITLADKGTLSDYKLTKLLRKLGTENNIPYQLRVASRGSNDAKAIQRCGGPAAACPISIPVRYIHSNVEVACKDDIEAAWHLVLELAKSNLEDF